MAFNPVLETNCALLVDRLQGLRTTDAFTASGDAPKDSPPFYGHVYTDTQGVTWQEINLQLLTQDPSFINIRV